MVNFSIGSLLDITGIRRRSGNPKQLKSSININQIVAISSDEQRALLERTHVPTGNSELNATDIINATKTINTDISTRIRENKQMRMLAPEIEQASAIMVPSILSPDDLQDDMLNFVTNTTNNEVDKIIPDVNEMLTEYFVNELELGQKLGDWLDTILYISGAKAILILPELYLSNMIKSNKIKAVSEFSGLENYLLNDNLFSGNSQRNVFSKTALGLEHKHAIYDSLFNIQDGNTDGKKTTPPADINKALSEITSLENLVTKQLGAVESLVTICENPSVAGLASLKRKYTDKKRGQKLNNMYTAVQDIKFTPEDIIAFDKVSYNDDDEIGNPFVMELPTASVIPIYTPGTPSDHIGYFIILDDKGNPIDVGSEPMEMQSSLLDSSFHAMFRTKGVERLTLIGEASGDKYKTAIMKVYENLLDVYIQNTLTAMEVDNVDISKNPAIYQCMFRRFLEKKSTKLVFVPPDFLIYFRFQHNDDGTGKSKLEDIKFIMSLRITLMVSRILAAMDEAIVREKVNLTFDEKISNPLEVMKQVKSRFIESKIVNFTYNPSQVVKSIADRGLTIIPQNIPGLKDFGIETEQVQKSKTRPDTELMDNLTNMYTLGLGPPPSAFNNLSENEYSRSVATTNLFFSKQIRNYQNITCRFMSCYAQTYLRYSKPLKDKLKAMIRENLKGATQNDVQAVETTDTLIDSILNEFITNLKATLPPPNIAPDKAQLEEFSSYKNILDAVTETIYTSDLLAKDRDAVDELNMIKSLIKSKLVRKYLTTSGFGKNMDLPELVDFNANESSKIHQALLNFRKRFDNQVKILSGDNNAGGDNGSSAW